ncbi:MAG: proline dehydrogenase family protein [Flavobacteriaceae bacterium]
MLFDDTQVAFRSKTNLELRRAQLLFRLVARQSLVRFGKWVTESFLRWGIPVSVFYRWSVFDHFCGGETVDDSRKVVDELHAQSVSSILHYSVEGSSQESFFDFTLEKTIETIAFAANNPAVPFAVFKPTAYGSSSVFEKKSKGEALDVSEQKAWEKIQERYHKTCAFACQHRVKLFIDAEESWIQDAMDQLSEQMMQKYNSDEVWIFHTIQMYRHDRLEYLQQLIGRAKQQGFKIGVKLVRGAYIEKENARAKKQQYPTPICASKAATDENFDAAVELILNHLDSVALFYGSHNEASAYRLMELLTTKKIDPSHPHLWFGQLYGMSDHISFNLAKAGFSVAKYVPYGPVKEVIPYLIRRADENTSVGGQTSKELELIRKEIQRRKLKAAV